MAQRSLDVFKQLKEAEQKFDYFILGLTVALFAYIGEKYVPEPLALSSNTLELLPNLPQRILRHSERRILLSSYSAESILNQ